MKLEKRKISGREKDEDSVKLLSQLRQSLFSEDSSVRRRAAFNLSWMQEDGLDILKEALFGKFPARTKSAAAYGLRSMRGRMKKMAWAVFEEGLQRDDRVTKQVCKKNLLGKVTGGGGNVAKKQKPRARKIGIREIRRKARPKQRPRLKTRGRTRPTRR